MAHTTFEQSIVIAASPEVVRARLTTLMTNVTELHPFVVKVVRTGGSTEADGTVIDRYQVTDRMKLGPFPIRFTYRVVMAVQPDGRLVSDAYQTPGVHLHNITWCEAEGDGTRVHEHIDITAPRLLLKTTYNGAATAHKEMFAKLTADIEAGTKAE